MSQGEQLQRALEDAEYQRTEVENLIDECVDNLREEIAAYEAKIPTSLLRQAKALVQAYEARANIDAEISRLLDRES